MISTPAGQRVLASLRDDDRAVIGDVPVSVRLLREVFAVAVRRCFTGREPREITGYVRVLLEKRDLPVDGGWRGRSRRSCGPSWANPSWRPASRTNAG